jgi:hypothetical protein
LLYHSLIDAIGELDSLLIRTLMGFSITEQFDCYQVEFSFAFWQPKIDDLESGHSDGVEQCPNVVARLSSEIDPREEIAQLEASKQLGTFHAFQIPPDWPGNDTNAPKWVVKCHAGSTAERLEWMKTIQ